MEEPLADATNSNNNNSVLPTAMGTPINAFKSIFNSKSTGKSTKSASAFKTALAAESTEENADPKGAVVTAQAQAKENKEEDVEVPEAENQEVEEDESEEDAEDAEAELLRRKQYEAHQQQLQEEQIQHLHLKTLTLQRSIEILQKQHEKEMRLKDQEIIEQRKRAQKSKEEEDAAAIEFHKEKIKAEAQHQTALNQLRSQLNQSKTMANSGPTGSFAMNKSFSMKNLLSSGRSMKLQAKVQANATERDHARSLRNLHDDLDKAKVELWKLNREKEQWIDIGAEKASELGALRDEAQKYYERAQYYHEKLRKSHSKRKALEQEKEDLVLKAGWAAEQLQQLTAELEYERQKHVKVSRLQILKQTEELQRLKEENEILKKDTPVKDGKPSTAAVKKTDKKTVLGQVKESAPVPFKTQAPALLGTETIAELVAMKAKQREQREIKMEALIKKNRESKQKRESIEDPNAPIDMNRVFIKAIGKRRDLMHEESSIHSELSDSENEW